MRILNIVEGFSEEGKSYLAAAGDVEYRTPTQDELERGMPHVDALLVRIGRSINAAVIDNSPDLKVIATATTGLNHIDVNRALERGIAVLSLKEETAFLDTITSTAELAFSLLLDLMRYNPWAFESVKRYEYKLEAFRGRSLYGKTLGIVGMGRLGKILAAGASGFRMNIAFTDPHVPQEQFPQYRKVSFDELLKESDAISIHVHLAPETEGLFSGEVLSKMKQGAYLVNTSRGEIVDEGAVLKALESGQLGGYATDVPTGEAQILERFEHNPMVEYAKVNQNLIIVPHTGGLTHDSRIGTDVFIAKKLADFLRAQR